MIYLDPYLCLEADESLDWFRQTISHRSASSDYRSYQTALVDVASNGIVANVTRRIDFITEARPNDSYAVY